MKRIIIVPASGETSDSLSSIAIQAMVTCIENMRGLVEETGSGEFQRVIVFGPHPTSKKTAIMISTCLGIPLDTSKSPDDTGKSSPLSQWWDKLSMLIQPKIVVVIIQQKDARSLAEYLLQKTVEPEGRIGKEIKTNQIVVVSSEQRGVVI